MAFKLVMFSDFICPFCYIGFETVRRVRNEFDLAIEWRGFEIHPDWPAGGISAERVYGALSSEQRRAAWSRIATMAEQINLPIKAPAMLCNSRLALEVAEYACDAGVGEAFEEGVYRAYFQEGRNISDRQEMWEIGRAAGLAKDDIEQVLASGKYRPRLEGATAFANQHGVSGVPTFFIGQFPLVGAQSEDAMRHVLRRAIERGMFNS